MGFSVHDALEAWQDGKITARRAMMLTGAGDVLELYAFAEACGVAVREGLTEAEAASVQRAGKAIDEAIAREGTRALGVA